MTLLKPPVLVLVYMFGLYRAEILAILTFSVVPDVVSTRLLLR